MSEDVKVVVVGSVALDRIETPSESRDEVLGGSVSYACAAASFFTRVGMVGVVGDDFPAGCRDRYARFEIDQSGLTTEPGKTFRWSGVYEPDMINRRTLSTELNVFERFAPDLPGAYRDAPFLMLGNISPELQLHVRSQARAPRFVIADTMDLWIDTAREPLMELVRQVDMLTVNDGEARMLTGEHNLRACAAKILEWGPSYVAIKKGEHGAMLVSKRGLFIVPAYPVETVRDPTGAGDSFAGGFLGALAGAAALDERAVRASLLTGAVVASFGVEAFGLERLEQLDRPAIDARLRELRDMVAA